MDATYVGNVGRNLEMYYDLNAVPDGARFLDLHPENRDPTQPDRRRCRRSSCGRIAATRTSACAAIPATRTTTRSSCR